MGAVSVRDAIRLVLANKSTGRFGRTKLMKYLYFLKEVGGLDVELEFELYSYGPFSSAVLQTLSSLDHKGEIKETPPNDDDELNSYDYELTQAQAPEIELTEIQRQLMQALSGRKALNLEALSTLHLTSRLLESSDEDLVVERVKNMKPYFRIEELRSFWRELVELGWVTST